MINNLKLQHRFFYIIFRIVLFLLITFNTTNFCFSQNMPVPENIQAALLPKVLKCNPDLAQQPKLRLLIVYDNNSQISKDEFIKGIGSILEVKALGPRELELNIGNCDLVYFMPGMQKFASICKINKILSVAGISQYVEQGTISMAFGIENNKPKIFISLSSLEKEGHSLSSEILRIARVYK
jgi:hypothetical protein